MRRLILLSTLPLFISPLLAAAQPSFPPPLITNLRALSSTSFLLQWDTPAPDVKEFRICRNGQAIATVPGATDEWTDTGLEPATVYSYTVSAVGNDNTESISRPVADVTRLPNEGKRVTRDVYDVVVVGATPGGIAAALAAARFGHRVALLSPTHWIGGMMTGGLSRTDFGSIKSGGGLFKEFADRVNRYYVNTYGADSEQVKACRQGYYFEPRVAKWVFHQMLAEVPNLKVFLDHSPRDVIKEGTRVSELLVLDQPRMIRKTFVARVFIDATYEGDVAALAGAAYRIGRESKTEFDEPHAGEIFWDPVHAAIHFGNGQGDRKVQAYNYRLCLTADADNRYPFPMPTQYDRSRYLTLLPDIANGRLKTMEQVLSILPLPNDEFDANNHPLGNPSSDLIGGAGHYPETDLWAREPIALAHRDHILGLFYFLQHDPAVPAAFQQEANRWGLAADEFVDNGRFPTQLYVREGRRITGGTLFTENNALSAAPDERPSPEPEGIAVADYPIDSHATSPEKDGLLEGFFYLAKQTQPSQVPYQVMTPLGIEGVLVSVCVSCTHIGYGTLRMEPVFMALGTAAGDAAHLALTSGAPPSRLDVTALQRLLLANGQVLCVFHDLPPTHPNWAAVEYFGVKGFFPRYEAEPDSGITRATAAQWLWQWMRLRQPGLEPMVAGDTQFADVPADRPEYLAICSLRAMKVLPIADSFGPDAPLSAAEASMWLERAARALALNPANRTTVIVPPAPAPEQLTRAEFCQLLYNRG